MTSLEVEEVDPGKPTGVVLALVGSSPLDESGKDVEGTRSLRMYSLSSLISLAKWTVSQQVIISPVLSRLCRLTTFSSILVP
jgi:hypothetical protein